MSTQQTLLRILVVVTLLGGGCHNPIERERKAYDMAFDTLYVNVFAKMCWKGTVAKTKSYLEEVLSDERVRETCQRLGTSIREMAGNDVKSRYRYTVVVDCAIDVLLTAYQGFLGHYFDEYNYIEKTLLSVGGLNLQSSYWELFPEIRKDYDRIWECWVSMQDTLELKLKAFPSYLEQKKDSLRESGWNKYLEWRKTYDKHGTKKKM